MSFPDLSPEEQRRYNRHIILPELGIEGQKKLKASHVAIVGLGGLGSPAALYLASAGVGRITLIDSDVVSLANLQRQILYTTEDVGQSKALQAAHRLRATNPTITIQPITDRLGASNAMNLLKGVDVVVDGTDNFPARYLTSDWSVRSGRPVVFGALEKFHGQVTVIHPSAGGPCYRCLFPSMPEAGTIPTCDEAGVLGVVPGFLGLLQATEALKLLLGIGKPLIGRILFQDSLSGISRTIPVRAVPNCPGCDPKAVRGPLIDETFSCGLGSVKIQELDALTLQRDYTWAGAENPSPDKSKIFLLDVRQLEEYQQGFIPGARLVPLAEIPDQLDDLLTSAGGLPIVCYCARGARSLKAAQQLAAKGYPSVLSLRGGYESWSGLHRG
jgi:adenylyltransferase/sulfurtransferase